MYKPDRVIVRKIREYDSHLFIEWNAKDGYFELWREMPHGRRLITPIVKTIYDTTQPKEFIEIDERLLWLLADWDSWKLGPKKHVLEGDRRWMEWNKKKDINKKSLIRDLSKDMYTALSGFYTTKHATKNPKHAVQRHISGTLAPKQNRPDMRSSTSGRLFQRSRGNALRYFGGR